MKRTNFAIFQLAPTTEPSYVFWLPHKLGNPIIGRNKLQWFVLDVQVRQPHQYWVWPNWIILNQDDLKILTDTLRRNNHSVWSVDNEIKQSLIEIGKIIKKEKTNQ